MSRLSLSRRGGGLGKIDYAVTMKDNPQEIIEYLIAEHGSAEAALNTAVEGAVEALKADDLYALSVWRDVKRILREKIEAD